METQLVPWGNKLVNGSWTGGMGVLQRKEADVCSLALGVTLERGQFIDFAISTYFQPMTLHAAIPTSRAVAMLAQK